MLIKFKALYMKTGRKYLFCINFQSFTAQKEVNCNIFFYNSITSRAPHTCRRPELESYNGAIFL